MILYPMNTLNEVDQAYLKFVQSKIRDLTVDEQELLLERTRSDPPLDKALMTLLFRVAEFCCNGIVHLKLGNGRSDSIPALLSSGEFVFTAKSVKQIGKTRLYELMDQAHQDADDGVKTVVLMERA